VCLNCGLVYLVDRLSRSGYDAFYQQGLYRDLIGRFKNAEQSMAAVHNGQRYYARQLATALDGMLPFGGGTLLDAGGSTGLVACEFANRFGYRPVIFDPSPMEVAAARKQGIEAHVATVEEFTSSEQYDVVLLCRTIEHLHDMRRALLRLRALIRPGGVLYCDFSDYLTVCDREGPPEATSKVDHCFWLLAETAAPILRSLGFEVVSLNFTMSPEQVGFLLSPCDPVPFVPTDRHAMEQWIRRLREVEIEWEKYSSAPLDLRDWLRRQAYRFKKRLGNTTYEPGNHSGTRRLQGNPAQEPAPIK
jgi:SAM-dependent methyltransferase